MNTPQRTFLDEPIVVPVPPAILRIADSEDRKLAWQFFVFFSRMEYALKRSQYLRKAPGDRAEPDWDQFAKAHAKEFLPDASEELKTAVDYFRRSPPRKQVVKDGILQWSEPQLKDPSESLLRWVIRVVCMVRNNLFHGGKFPGGFKAEDPSRDKSLLGHSICVLNAVLLLDAKVRHCFEESL